MTTDSPGPVWTVPGEDGAEIVAEATRLAERLGDTADGDRPADERADGDRPADDWADSERADADRPRVVALAFDGVTDPETLRPGNPDELVRIERADGEPFESGSAGVRARATALQSLVGAVDDRPTAVLLPGTPDGDEVAAATARRLRSGCVLDCILRVRDGELRAGRTTYGGRAYAEFSFEGGPPAVSLHLDALGQPETEPDPEIAEREREVDLAGAGVDAAETGLRRLDVLDVPEENLSRARRIAAGGYGLGGPDGFEEIEELADALGAAVGASRPPADEGWVPYDRQIGVTGKEIDVELYVPCAISGDPYHLRSVNAAHMIPINVDPEAHIFNVCDLGVVGDVFEYAPAIAAAVREASEGEGAPGDAEDAAVPGDAEDATTAADTDAATASDAGNFGPGDAARGGGGAGTTDVPDGDEEEDTAEEDAAAEAEQEADAEGENDGDTDTDDEAGEASR